MSSPAPRRSNAELSIEPLLRRPRLIGAVYLFLAAAMAPGLLRLKHDNSPEVFFVRDARLLQHYRSFELDFGRDRALRIVLRGERLWTAEGLKWLEWLERQLPNLSGVVAAAGPYRHHRWRFAEWPPSDPGSFRTEVVSDPLDRNAAWVSRDGEVVTVLAALYKLPVAKQRRLLAQVEDLLQEAPAGIVGTLTGLPVINRALDDAIAEMSVRFFPMLAVLAIVLLIAFFRRPAAVLAPLLLVGICQIVLFGVMGWVGETLNIVTIILLPLLFVISLATAVHLLATFRRLRGRGMEPRQAAVETYRLKGWSVIWTGITTGVGFGSFAVSSMPPVRALGVWSAFGIAFMTLAAFSLFPVLLASMQESTGESSVGRFEVRARRWGRAWAQWAVKERGLVMASFGAVALLAAGGLPRLRIDTNVMSYFPQEHPVRVELDELQKLGVGTIAAELVLTRSDASEATDDERFDHPEILARLARLSDDLRSEPLLLGVTGPADLIDDVTRYRPESKEADPQRERAAALDIVRRSPDLTRLFNYLVTRDGRRARISLLVPMGSLDELQPLFSRVLQRASAVLPEVGAEITGQYPLVLAAQRTLLRTMFVSLSLTLLCVTVIFRLLLGSGTLAVRALVPNVWPVVFVLGAMGWLAVPIDSTTVMIASAVLGLAVDDTLHTLGAFRRLTQRMPPAPAVVEALTRLAGAHTATTAILAAGFGVCGLSSFVPTARFGSLTALALLMALAADLLLVPALFAAATPEAVARLGRGFAPQHEAADHEQDDQD